MSVFLTIVFALLCKTVFLFRFDMSMFLTCLCRDAARARADSPSLHDAGVLCAEPMIVLSVFRTNTMNSCEAPLLHRMTRRRRAIISRRRYIGGVCLVCMCLCVCVCVCVCVCLCMFVVCALYLCVGVDRCVLVKQSHQRDPFASDRRISTGGRGCREADARERVEPTASWPRGDAPIADAQC